MTKTISALKPKRKTIKKDKPSSEDFYRAIIDGMQCGIISIDTHGRVVKINQIARRILEIGESSPENSSMEKDGKEADHISVLLKHYPHLSQLLLESFHMSALPNRDEIDLSEAGKGRKKKIGFSISLIKNREGENIGCSIFFKDLTRIEEKEEQKQLQERLAALGHMSASLAHELRNPLAAIEVNASFLKRKLKEDGEARNILDGIISDIGRLKITINESLSFVRPLEVNLFSSRLEEVVEKALWSALTTEDLKNIRVERESEAIDAFLFDPELLFKALINIFKNAAEAMDYNGTIEIGLKKLGDGQELHAASNSADIHHENGKGRDYAMIRIRDHGKGIPKDIIEKVFYPFFTTKEKGSGLGLSFTKKVVDAHKGFIDVESHENVGTTFMIRIPIVFSHIQG